MRGLRILVACALSCLGVQSTAQSSDATEPAQSCSSGEWGPIHCISKATFEADVCRAIEGEARTHQVDPYFFTRLIWQESRFDPNALSHANAMGIAQFIASTAALRGLTNPYNPAEALEHSAQYLAELRDKFGGYGGAAIAYNGGETRAENWFAKTGSLPTETRNYVAIITGLSAEAWRDTPPKTLDLSFKGKPTFGEACLALAKDRRLTPFKTPAAQPPPKPWAVQLLVASTRSAARSRVGAQRAQCKAVRGGMKVVYTKVKTRIKNRSYTAAQLRYQTRNSAVKMCSRLSRAGCNCRVIRD